MEAIRSATLLLGDCGAWPVDALSLAVAYIGTLSHETPECYWEFMADVAAPVVAGLAGADGDTRELIRTQILEQA